MNKYQEIINKYYPGKDLFKDGMRNSLRKKCNSKEEVIEDFILHKFFNRPITEVQRELWKISKEKFEVKDEELIPEIKIDTKMPLTTPSGITVPLSEKEDLPTVIEITSPDEIKRNYNFAKILRTAIRILDRARTLPIPEPHMEALFPENIKICKVGPLISSLSSRAYAAKDQSLRDQLESFIRELSNYGEPDIEDSSLLRTLVQKIEEADSRIPDISYSDNIPNPLHTVFNGLPENAEIIVISTRKLPKTSVEMKYMTSLHFREDLHKHGYTQDNDLKLFIENLDVMDQQDLLEHF